MIIFERMFVRFGSSGESTYIETKASCFEVVFPYFSLFYADIDGKNLTKRKASLDFIIKAVNGLTKMSAMKYRLSRRPPQSPSQSNKLSVLRRILCTSGLIAIVVLKNLYYFG